MIFSLDWLVNRELIYAAFPLPQSKERGSTRVHSLNNVNKVLQVLHQNNVSTSCLVAKLLCICHFLPRAVKEESVSFQPHKIIRNKELY